MIRCHQERGDRIALAMVYNNLGSLYGDMGNYLRAERFFRETIRIRRAAKHVDLAVALTNLGAALYHLEKWTDSRAILDEALALMTDGKAPSYMHSGLYRYHGLLALREGAIDLASTAIESALTAAESMGALTQIVEAEVARARVLLARSELETAIARFERALGRLDAEAHGMMIGRILAHWADDLRVLAPRRAQSYDSWAVALTGRGQS